MGRGRGWGWSELHRIQDEGAVKIVIDMECFGPELAQRHEGTKGTKTFSFTTEGTEGAEFREA